MVLSLLSFSYIVAAAVVAIVLFSVRLYLENSKFSEELKFHLQQKTISSNLAQARLAVLTSKHNDLNDKLKGGNQEDLKVLNQKIMSLKEEIRDEKLQHERTLKEEKEKFVASLKDEKEMSELATLNFKEMETLNKTFAKELDELSELNKTLTSRLKEAEELNKSLKEKVDEVLRLNKDLNDKSVEAIELKKTNEPEIEHLKIQLNEISSDRKIILTKLIGYETREEVLQSKISEQLKQAQYLEVKIQNQNLMIEFLNGNLSEKNKITNELKENIEVLNQKLIAERKRITAHEKIDMINRRDKANEEPRLAFESNLTKRVLKFYSVILKLEKRNLILKNQIKSQQVNDLSANQNVIPFPVSENHNNSKSSDEINNIREFLSQKKTFDLQKMESNELEMLKAKLDEARTSLFRIQSSDEHFVKAKIKNVA